VLTPGIVRKVRAAVAGRRLRRAAPRVARPDEVDAQLDALYDEIVALTRLGCDDRELVAMLAYACARAEEWTA
jgi:hypothetical protein